MGPRWLELLMFVLDDEARTRRLERLARAIALPFGCLAIVVFTLAHEWPVMLTIGATGTAIACVGWRTLRR